MPLPNADRVIYSKDPLIEVVFQCRFPKFLPIESEPPSEFQKRIIQRYPVYEQRSVFQIMLATSAQEGLQPAAEGRLHIFTSADKIWTITLSGDSISVTTRKYTRWEDFSERSRFALTNFLEVYPLPIFTRVGLRYQNLIRRHELGLEATPWSQLLKPHIAGELSEGSIVEEDFVAKTNISTIKLADGDLLGFRHGLVIHKETQKMAYLLDGDFYNEEQRTTDPDGTLSVANRLHTNSGRLFRWCISSPLHEAMGPTAA